MGKRLYHLGLDWGTSATKLVLRDYEQQTAFVLFPGGKSTYRYPSTVVQKGPKLFFGFKAEEYRDGAKPFDALKAAIYSGDGSEFSEAEDLATLYLAHVINVGFDFAEQHAMRANDEALLGLTLGIPAEELEQTELKITYLRIIRTAYEIAVHFDCNLQGEDLDDCLTVLDLARLKVRERDINFPPRSDSYKQWLRPELAAAMYWSMKSPTLQDGLFSCVDIGAWTTNASYFRIHTDAHRQKKISFYGGACRPPGMIKLVKSLSEARGKLYTNYLGREDSLFSGLEATGEHEVKACGQEYFSTWKLGFQKSYPLEPKQGAFDGKLNAMIIGGGSKVAKIKGMFLSKFPGPQNFAPPIPVPDLGTPSDLFDLPLSGVRSTRPFEGDSSFLLVAYGLSVNNRDFPETTLSPDVPPFDPQPRQRPFKSSEELGYDQ